MNDKKLMVVGLSVCVSAAVLMVTGTLTVPSGIVVGMIGVGLLSAFAAKRS